ncbi:MAG TPA: ABC transporter permease, partial [Puia sp.]|nr:ABC transporter permease [Puia sp.]
MFTRYLILALRHFRRSRVTTIINVLGLSIGISAAVIVFLFIQYNFSFDQFEPARGRMYRVEPAPLPLYSQLKQLPAGIEAVTAIVSFDGNPKLSIRSDSTVETLKNQSDVVFTDSTYFRLFPHVWLAGNPEAAMRWPNQLVLSESRLRQYFPGESADAALGKVIIFDDSIRTVVSGIVKDLDVNSDFECKLYISLPTLTQSSSRRDYGWDNWGRSSSWSPVLISLTPKTRPQQVSNEIAEISRAFNPDASRNKKIPQLQALSEVHAIDGNVSPSAIDGLVLLAFVLVLLGAINFINLATAQSTQRAAETGIRKILGSSRRDLILQSLTETVLLMLVTTCLCMELIWAGATKFLPAEFHLGHSVRFITIIGFVLFLSVLVSVVAGLYPAFVLSRFLPVQVLKSQGSGSYPGSQRTAWLRKTLTVSQFVVAQVFLIGVIIVNKQVLYALNKDMGFRRDAIVVMHVPADGNKFLFQHTLRAMPEIQKTSFGEEPPAFSGQVSGSIG